MFAAQGSQGLESTRGIRHAGAQTVILQGGLEYVVSNAYIAGVVPTAYLQDMGMYPRGCSMRVTGIAWNATEGEVMNHIVTRGGIWQWGNCGTIASHVMRHSSREGYQDGGIQ